MSPDEAEQTMISLADYFESIGDHRAESLRQLASGGDRDIWAIASGEYSDYRILAVCESKRAAQAWVDALSKQDDEDYSGHSSARLECLTLLDPKAKPKKVTIYKRSADVWDNGTVTSEREWSTTGWTITHYETIPVRPATRYVRAPCHNGVGGRIDVRGPTAKSVAKVFSEKLAMWKAGAWAGPSYPEINES